MGNFKIGEKVVCIDDSNPFGYKEEIFPKKNEIYTIRCNKRGIKLLEIINSKKRYIDGFYECTFNENRFRKLDYEFAENLLAEISEAMKSETIKN